MTLLRRDYESGADFLAIQDVTQRAWPTNPRWHVGEVAWTRASAGRTAPSWRTALWHDDDHPVAWAWLEPPGELSLLMAPDGDDLGGAILDWLDEGATAGEHTCTLLETETALADALTLAGFAADADRPYFRYHSMSLDVLDDPVLPPGFRLRHIEFGEAEARAAVHRSGWSDFGSTLSTETYADVMATWPYRPELDWVVETADGEPVASALGWLDDVNCAGLLEPVGCAPAYRRKGLARAVNLKCLQAMRDAGARTGYVNPRGDAGYPVPGLLYRSIGFQPGPRTITYVRSERSTLRYR
jgi:hypothetical protein